MELSIAYVGPCCRTVRTHAYWNVMEDLSTCIYDSCNVKGTVYI